MRAEWTVVSGTSAQVATLSNLLVVTGYGIQPPREVCRLQRDV